jgi:catechol 2,3-dioxygenase-like lactoylglutathione lyase family enzyme
MGIVQDIGHVLLQVGDMKEALRFYCDGLGFRVQGATDPVWTVVAVEGGSLTLYRKTAPIPCVLRDGGSPLNLHVEDFESAARTLESAGYAVQSRDAHHGSVRDPWGNVVGLHDHREG